MTSFEKLPDRPRQQHRVDLGAPGADAGALVRRLGEPGAALRGGAPRRAGRAARCRGAARRGRSAMRDKVRAARPVQGRLLRRQAQRRRHDGRGVRGAVAGADAERGAPRAAGQRRQHRAAAACRGLRPAARRASAMRRGRCLPRPAPRTAPRAAGRAADAGRARGDGGAARRGAGAVARRVRRQPVVSRWREPGGAWCAVAAAAGARRALAQGRPPPPRLAAGAWRPAQPWRAFSAAFVHYSALHLAGNAAGLALVGGARRRGPRAGAAWRWPGWQPGR